jgi:hypothetical protein
VRRSPGGSNEINALWGNPRRNAGLPAGLPCASRSGWQSEFAPNSRWFWRTRADPRAHSTRPVCPQASGVPRPRKKTIKARATLMPKKIHATSVATPATPDRENRPATMAAITEAVPRRRQRTIHLYTLIPHRKYSAGCGAAVREAPSIGSVRSPGSERAKPAITRAPQKIIFAFDVQIRHGPCQQISACPSEAASVSYAALASLPSAVRSGSRRCRQLSCCRPVPKLMRRMSCPSPANRKRRPSYE